MDNTIKNVSVEVSGSSIQALTCLDEASDPGVRLDHLDDKGLIDPETFFSVSQTFSVIPLPREVQTTPDSDRAHFALQSRLNNAYLGFNPNDRRLLMQAVQYPPPDPFRFAFSSDIPDDGFPVHIVAADGKPVNDPNNAEREFPLVIRFLQESNSPGGIDESSPWTIDESWKQQLALISVLGEKESADEVATYGELGASGKGRSSLNNEVELAMVKEMSDSGDLEVAINALAEERDDDSLNEGLSPDSVVKMAQLLCIMDLCVYMRDVEREEYVHSQMQPYATEIKAAVQNSEPVSEAALDAMMKVQADGDRATKKIQEVASSMKLKYQPLCNFSSDGKLLRNGPYCGAFYGHSKDQKPFIVLAFKGTGRPEEWGTNIKLGKKETAGSSPLEGKCHTGYFDGIFKDFPCDLSTNKKIKVALPFLLLRDQIFKLGRELLPEHRDRELLPKHPPPPGPRVQTWVTGHSLGGAYATICWTGLVAGSMRYTYSTMRGLLTFGSPRVGNEKYAAFARSRNKFRETWRFVNGNDIVTGLPFKILSYVHVDWEVNISPSRISLGKSELKSVQDHSKKAAEEIESAEINLEKISQNADIREAVVFGGWFSNNHSLKSYWDSLRNGTLANHDPWH